MIYRARTLNLTRSKISEAHALMLKAAAYLNENFPDITVEVLRNIGGPVNQIHMVTSCASLAVLEEYEAERQLDVGWLALLEEWRALDAEACTAVDHLYRSLICSKN